MRVVLAPCDPRIFQLATARALQLVGPNRFFSDLRRRYSAEPALLRARRHRALQRRMAERHVVVDGVFIDDKSMSRRQADRLFDEITRELKAGRSFAEVREKYQTANEYSYDETFPDGKKVKQTRTRLGNDGDYLISRSNRSARPFREVEVPAEHAALLFERKKGDVFVLRDVRL